MEIRFDRADFENLIQQSCRWTPGLALQNGRWEKKDSTPEGTPITGWRYAHWIGDQWLSAVFARAWLDEQREEYEIVWDTTIEEYAILTNYSWSARTFPAVVQE